MRRQRDAWGWQGEGVHLGRGGVQPHAEVLRQIPPLLLSHCRRDALQQLVRLRQGAQHTKLKKHWRPTVVNLARIKNASMHFL